MEGHRSPDETLNDLLVSFHRGYLKQISHQLVTIRAELRSGQQQLRSSTDHLLVSTGQVLDGQRQIMAKLDTAPPPSGRPNLKSLWAEVKEWLSGFVLLHKALSAWRAISWPVNVTVWGSMAAKWLGWL